MINQKIPLNLIIMKTTRFTKE